MIVLFIYLNDILNERKAHVLVIYTLYICIYKIKTLSYPTLLYMISRIIMKVSIDICVESVLKLVI
jgi:hypothetical protein